MLTLIIIVEIQMFVVAVVDDDVDVKLCNLDRSSNIFLD